MKFETHHGEYEPTAPKHHWSGWHAAYIVARQEGKTPEEAAKNARTHIEGVLAKLAPFAWRDAHWTRPGGRDSNESGRAMCDASVWHTA